MTKIPLNSEYMVDPTCSPTPSLNTPLFHFYPSLFSSSFLYHIRFNNNIWFELDLRPPTMMSCFEPVQYQFTPEEIHQLLSLFQTDSPVNSTSGSEVNRPVYSMEERKRRRMLSNRESARRSRQRKKRNLEKLNHQLNCLKVENRELKNRLCLLRDQFCYVFSETDQLRSEYMDLQNKLAGLSHILVAMHAVPLNPTNLN